jgi:hypothetical protein
MRWFCDDNLGFGEIEQAFKLFIRYFNEINLIEDDDVDIIQDIIDKRLSGLGWGQVKHEMAGFESGVSPEVESATKKEPPGKEKSEEAKNKEKPNKKKDE